MMHTENINFSRYGEEFAAIVTWDDQPWKNLGSKATKAFWKATLICPKLIDIQEHRISAGGLFSRMGLSRCNDNFLMIEDASAEWGAQNIKNIYPWVIEEILYRYYAEDCDACYRKYVEKIKSALDSKYAKVFELIHCKKQELRKQLRSEDLDSKGYQILLRPIRIEKENLELKISGIKHWIENRYFTCCKLKEAFQYRPGKVKHCPLILNEELV